MNIFYQNDSFFYVVKKEDNNVVKKRVYKKIDDILEENIFLKNKNYFLLEENNFIYYSLNIDIKLDEKLTIIYLKKLINNKILYLKVNYNINGKKLITLIDNILVNGKMKKYIIGETGHIKFLLNIVFLKNETLNLFESHFGLSFINNSSFEIIPKSLYTLYFIKNILGKNDFNVLYVLEDKVKLLNIKNGFYNDFAYIDNLGLNMLKSIYKENNILQYLFISNISNNFIKDLSLKSLDFYNTILINWLNENLIYGGNVLLLSDINKNVFFVDDFVKKYKSKINGYLLPLNSFDVLNKFSFNWNCDEMDLLTFLNNKQFF